MIRYSGIVFRIQILSGCGSVWLEHLVWDQGVAGSNPVTPIFKGLLRQPLIH